MAAFVTSHEENQFSRQIHLQARSEVFIVQSKIIILRQVKVKPFAYY